MELNQFIPAIESLIFTAPQAIKLEEIKYCLENTYSTSIELGQIEELVEIIRKRYEPETYGMELRELAGGLQFMSKPAQFNVIAEFIKLSNKKKLTRASMESLAIIAYKQPISKSEVEQIRGVNSDHSIQKLLEKELIEIKGRSEGPGRPILFGTSARFMEYFGLNSLEDLPKMKDFALPSSEVGEPAPLEESVEIVADESQIPANHE
ncbi:MAG: SMC-Scp complex subunit ScpB [Saprospiraceae bacterium]|nr:SMC-Scp complex subunit ScpB [Saprospiraceae bacterium]